MLSEGLGVYYKEITRAILYDISCVCDELSQLALGIRFEELLSTAKWGEMDTSRGSLLQPKAEVLKAISLSIDLHKDREDSRVRFQMKILNPT